MGKRYREKRDMLALLTYQYADEELDEIQTMDSSVGQAGSDFAGV